MTTADQNARRPREMTVQLNTRIRPDIREMLDAGARAAGLSTREAVQEALELRWGPAYRATVTATAKLSVVGGIMSGVAHV